MRTLLQDIRYGVRMLWKNPGVTAVAVIALALGIGANTAIFSVVNAVLLRPLPFADPDRLVIVKSVNAKGDDKQWGGVSPADFLDWKAQQQSFEFITAYSGGGTILTEAEQPEQFPGTRVSDDFFSVFGVKPMLGRTFVPEEFATGSQPAVVLSHRLWQRRFGGDPALVGKTLSLDGKSTTVVGVMPPEFKYPANAEVWTPVARNSSEMQLRGNRYYAAAARLKPGVTLAQAEAEMRIVAGRLEGQYPQSNTGWGCGLFRCRRTSSETCARRC